MINNNELRIGNLVLAPKALAENSYEEAEITCLKKLIEIAKNK